MVQEGTPNLDLTLRGYPMKFCSVLDKAAHNTHQIVAPHARQMRNVCVVPIGRADLGGADACKLRVAHVCVYERSGTKALSKNPP